MLRRTPFAALALLFALGCNLDDEGTGTANSSNSDIDADAGFNNLLECTTPEILCGEACVDATSTDNCGGCGVVCGSGEACVDGACELECSDGEVACDGTCIDPSTNATFCGATADCEAANAGTTCADDEVCASGMCECVTENPGITVSAVSGVAIEGGEAVTYTVVLTEEPCNPVTIALTTDEQITADQTSLTFTLADWDQAQTVSVSAVLDALRETDHNGTITHSVTSDDPAYDGFDLAAVTVGIENTVSIRKVVVAADGSEPDGHSYTPDISDDGRYVAFLSRATNLTTDTITDATLNQVFWRDLETGETRLVSKGMNGPGDGTSAEPRISADGQTVAFASSSTNLTMTVADSGSLEIFVYSVGDDAVEQVSDPCTTCSNREMSGTYSMSADGDLVAYSTRRRIAAEDASNEYSVYTYRRSTQTVELVSLNADGGYPTPIWGNNVFAPVLSANGDYVGWHSAGGNIVAPDPTVQNFHAYFKDLTTKIVRRVSVVDDMQTPCGGASRLASSGPPFVANDGSTALFSTRCPMDQSATSYPFTQIYIWDNTTQTNTRITQSANGLPDGESADWGYSDDGHYALIASRATNLEVTDGPTNANAAWQLYVYDSMTGEMNGVNFGRDYRWSTFGLAYRADAIAETDSPSWAARISGNGAHVAFATVDPMFDDMPTAPMNYTNIYVVTLF